MKTTIKKTIMKKLLTDEQLADILECMEVALLGGIVENKTRKSCRKVLLDTMVIYQRSNLQESTFNAIKEKNRKKVDGINKKVIKIPVKIKK